MPAFNYDLAMRQMNLGTVRKFSLIEKQLTYLLPNFTQQFSDLIELDLSKNKLTDLPYTFISLKKLQCIVLNCNNFVCIPSVLWEMHSLKVLKACNNNIFKISEQLSALENLEELDLSSNQIQSIPLSCMKLNRLKTLILTNNKFKQMPEPVTCGMRNLQTLDLSLNFKCNIYSTPHSAELMCFHARNNVVTTQFPTWIFNLTFKKLKEVDFDGTMFQKIDITESSVSHVKHLSLQQCKLSSDSLKAIVSTFPQLEKMFIGNAELGANANIFWMLPIDSLKQPSSLKEFRASCVTIPIIPRVINMLTNLSILDFSHNKLHWLPDECCQLKHLQVLVINDSSLYSLPDNIGQLSMLRELRACSNNLAHLPESFKLLNKLLYLGLYNNEFKSVDNAISNIPNLVGLDLEQNYFSTDSLLIRNIQYDHLKMALRGHWNENHKRFDGPRTEVLVDESTNSGSSSLEDINNCAQNVVLTDSNGEKDLKEENWDISEDSADEYDPHECLVPKARMRSPFVLYAAHQPVFCPADIHPPRSIDRIKIMRQQGTLAFSSNIVEGQFEDA